MKIRIPSLLVATVSVAGFAHQAGAASGLFSPEPPVTAQVPAQPAAARQPVLTQGEMEEAREKAAASAREAIEIKDAPEIVYGEEFTNEEYTDITTQAPSTRTPSTPEPAPQATGALQDDMEAQGLVVSSGKREKNSDRLEQPASPDTLRGAVLNGLRSNPEFGEVAKNRLATDEELNQAQALYYPSIDVSGNAGPEYTKRTIESPTSRDENDDSLFRYDIGVTLTQMLFDGWGTKYEKERQAFRVLSASNRVRESSELVGLSIIESYLEVLRQRELLAIARSNVADHVSISGRIGDSSTAGRTTQADVDQSAARLAAARAQEASIAEALAQAEARFIRHVGQMPGALSPVDVQPGVLSGSVDNEVRLAIQKSPTIDVYRADAQVAAAENDGADASLYPHFDLQLNARTGENQSGVEGDNRSASALVVMNWNLYRGGGDQARIREAAFRQAQAEEARRAAERQVASDVRETWARMIGAGQRKEQYATQVRANSNVVAAYKDQFDLNRRTLLDVLDSQNELFVSRSNLVNDRYLEVFANYRLLALKGELLRTLGIPAPEEAKAPQISRRD